MRALAILLAGSLLWAAEPAPSVSDRLQAMAIAFAEAQSSALAGTYTFKVINPPALPRGNGADLRFEASHLSKKEPSGHFFACFRTSLDGHPLGMVRVDLEGKWVGKLLRAKVALARRVIPEADQVEEKDFEGVPPAGAISAVPEGYRMRNPVTAGHVLTMADLEAIPVVMSGDRVRLELTDGALSVAVEALARGNAAVGEKVRLEMPTSHKTVTAVVMGPGEARARWGGGK